MNLYAAPRSRGPGCAAAGLAPGNPPDRQIVKQLIQRPGGLGLQGLDEGGQQLSTVVRDDKRGNGMPGLRSGS